jgi:hypothetical protein
LEKTEIEARTQNLARREGPVVSAVVEFKPQCFEKIATMATSLVDWGILAN